jgi:hypothetical protein
MLSGVTDPVFVLQRIDTNGNPYPFTLQTRDQTEFTGDFETVWNLLLSSPAQPFGKLYIFCYSSNRGINDKVIEQTDLWYAFALLL